MPSKGLKQFKQSVGDAIHSINTICVGLDGVANLLVTKSDTLTISWRTSDPKKCSISSRNFAIRSGLVYVHEAFRVYLNYVSTHPTMTYNIELSRKNAMKDKIELLEEHVKCNLPYWFPFIKLLNIWRNKVVHDSTTTLSPNDRKILLSHEDVIHKNHAAISIKQTLENLDKNNITLKDFTTIIAVTIKFVMFLDEYVQVDSASEDNLVEYLIKNNLINQYFKILGVNGATKQRTKFNNFIKCHFSYYDDNLDELFENRFTIKERLRENLNTCSKQRL